MGSDPINGVWPHYEWWILSDSDRKRSDPILNRIIKVSFDSALQRCGLTPCSAAHYHLALVSLGMHDPETVAALHAAPATLPAVNFLGVLEIDTP